MTTPLAIARAVGVLGHELRNPLAAAVTGAALLREMLDGDDPRRSVADGVTRDLQRMSALIDHYLDLARCGQPRREPVALRRIAAAVAARRAEVALAVDEDVELSGDAVLLERALDNLVDNAVQAGARHVRIAGRRQAQELVLTVEDDGPGVPVELRQRIFEPGFSRRGSTGLGLGFVAQVVGAHGGRVRCEAGERGARFELRLPASDVAARQGSESPHGAEAIA